ncbi:D-alanyl-D-alanine carboxypeptidase family protein [Geitlerinema sp. CS-897]|nr:D-alanyl-D-alanine carboxypeptidase family protein [Geitlerinema sp. CS-897]
MKKSSRSGKSLQTTSRAAIDDIPEALRDAPIPATAPPSAKKGGMGWAMGSLMALSGVGVLTLGTVLWFVWQSERAFFARSNAQSEETAESQFSDTTEPTPEDDNLLGHLPYEEAPTDDLEPILADGSLKLRRAAAEAYLNMEADARADGVRLVPISAFRSVEDQQYLFFEVKAQRGQIASERAEVSAPPGYSEHHTGYAIDIGDGDVPATHVSPEFENTKAFEWLQNNAAHYSFELSFPKDNPQNIAYEPWHWRFVGDRHSLETFYKAHQQQDEGMR